MGIRGYGSEALHPNFASVK